MNPFCTVKCWLSSCTDWRVYTTCMCVFSYCCGKQVVFFSHSRRLLKQRAFSINLSISAATPLTAGWRAGCEVGRVQYEHTHTHMHTMWVLPGERCGRWLMYLFMWMSSASGDTGERGGRAALLGEKHRWGGWRSCRREGGVGRAELTVWLKKGFTVWVNELWWQMGELCVTSSPLHLWQWIP